MGRPMIVREISDSKLVPDYGTLFQQIYPDGGEDLADWGVGRAVVEPGTGTAPHSHDEHEMFIVTRGAGTITIDHEERELVAGQAVLIPAGSTHTFANHATEGRLEFFNVYWPPSHGEISI
jgi:mannose-6-phosphate isomerase-like protein (cupin superfamily)